MEGKDLEALRLTSDALCRLLRKSFGPRGFDKLLVSLSGQNVPTSNGTRLLEHLDAAHSTAVFLTGAIKESARDSAHGGTSLALMVAEAIQHAASELDGGPRWGCPTSQISGAVHALRSLKAWFLDAIVLPSIHGQALAVQLEDFQMATATLQKVLVTIFVSQSSPASSFRLAKLVVEIVMREIRSLSSPSDAMDMLAIWSSSPPIVLAPGTPMAGVDLVDGLIIERPLRSASMPTRLCPVKTIVLSSRLEYSDAPLQVSTTIQVDSKASYHAAMADNERAVAVRIKALQQNNVNLVICTEPISDMASHLLSQAGIAAVQLVPRQDAMRIATAVGCNALINDTRPESLLKAQIGAASSLEQWASSPSSSQIGKENLIIRFAAPHRHGTLVVRGPNQAQCKIHAGLAEQGFLAIKQAIRRTESGLEVSVVPGGGSIDLSISAAVQVSMRALQQQLDDASGTISPGDIPRRVSLQLGRRSCQIALTTFRAMAVAAPEALVTSSLWKVSKQHQLRTRAALLQKLLCKHEGEGSGCRIGCIFPEFTHKYVQQALFELRIETDSQGSNWEESLESEIVFGDGLEWGCCHSTESVERMWSCAVEIVVQVLSIERSVPAKRIKQRGMQKARRRPHADNNDSTSGSSSSSGSDAGDD